MVHIGILTDRPYWFNLPRWFSLENDNLIS